MKAIETLGRAIWIPGDIKGAIDGIKEKDGDKVGRKVLDVVLKLAIFSLIGSTVLSGAIIIAAGIATPFTAGAAGVGVGVTVAVVALNILLVCAGMGLVSGSGVGALYFYQQSIDSRDIFSRMKDGIRATLRK